MREIKFRAYNKIQSKMIPVVVMPNGQAGHYDHVSKDAQSYADGVCSEPMQYIGLKDRDGVEIYEGDLIKTWHPFSEFDYNKNRQEDFCTGVWLCVWDSPKFFFDGVDSRCIGVMLGVNSGLCEVIGNIHQHPELLEAE